MSAGISCAARYEHLNDGDFESALALIHPDVEWHTYIVPRPGGGLYHGHEGVRALWSDAQRDLR